MALVKFWTRLIYHPSYGGPSPGPVVALVGSVIILGQAICHVADLSGARGYPATLSLAVRGARGLTALAAAADGEQPATRGTTAQTPNVVMLLRHGPRNRAAKNWTPLKSDESVRLA